MHLVHLQISDEVYSQAKQAAEAEGFTSTEDYIAKFVESNFVTENADAFFSPSIVAEIQAAAVEADPSTSSTIEEFRHEARIKRATSLANRPA